MNTPIIKASFNLTRNCNLRCGFCFTYGHDLAVMSKDIAFRAVDYLFNNAIEYQDPKKKVEISFWGGEPLLEWNLLQEITLYAEDVSRKTAIPVNFGGTTNGTLLTEEKFDFLDEHKIYFMVSFDGTAETHNTHRKFSNGVGSHSIVENNLIKVLARWPSYRVRLSPFAQRIDHFYEDMKYIFDLGVTYIMFSPVYESNFTSEHWKIFEEQCLQVVDYIVELRNKGKRAEVEHFKAYIHKDSSRFACGSGRFYVGIDIDGAIYPCHRYNKFNDNRPWQEKEVCIGHIDYGITRPEFRQIFIDAQHVCGNCERLKDTPCNGGCPAVNYDFNKDPMIPYGGICKYVEVQKRVSDYYKTKIKEVKMEQKDSCICNNLCYAQGTDEEIIGRNLKNPVECVCYNSNYTGPTSPDVAGPMPKSTVEGPSIEAKLNIMATILGDLHRRVSLLEKKNG